MGGICFHTTNPTTPNPTKTNQMEDTTWEQRTQALTHILTTPTTTPSLHSQYLISSHIPCYLNWDYPPLLCPNPNPNPSPSPNPKPYPLFNWTLSQLLKRVARLGQPLTSWRSKCPYYQPPPLILAKGVEEAKWDDEGKKEYVRMRLRRKRLQSEVHPLIPVVIPNLLLFSMLLWNPYPEYTS